MVSPELIRRYPFFAGLSMEQITTLAQAADESTVETGHYFFHEGEDLHNFYLTLEGAIGIVIELTAQNTTHSLSEQITGALQTDDVVVTTVGPGEVFGWSAMLPPHKATASAKALTPCRIVAFDCQELLNIFEEDCRFGYLMIQKAAQVIRGRLRDMRIESLAHMVG